MSRLPSGGQSVVVAATAVCVALGSGCLAADVARERDRLVGSIRLEQVTGFQIDAAARAVDFQMTIKNESKETIYLKDPRFEGVSLSKKGESLPIGTGAGTTLETIQPVQGFAPANGWELKPALSRRSIRVSLPADAAAMSANLIAIFNVLNEEPSGRDLALLFAGAAKAGVQDANGVEYTAIDLQKRLTASFDNLIGFESAADTGNLDLPAGKIVISRIASCKIVTEANTRSFHIAVVLENRSDRHTLFLREPKFSDLQFLWGDKRVTIGTGTGRTPETFVPTEGFAAVNGMLLGPGSSVHRLDVPMDADDAVAMRNIVDIMNIMGSPAVRSDVALLLAVQTKAGVKTAQGMEAVAEYEAQKRFKAVVRGEYLFK